MSLSRITEVDDLSAFLTMNLGLILICLAALINLEGKLFVWV